LGQEAASIGAPITLFEGWDVFDVSKFDDIGIQFDDLLFSVEVCTIAEQSHFEWFVRSDQGLHSVVVHAQFHIPAGVIGFTSRQHRAKEDETHKCDYKATMKPAEPGALLAHETSLQSLSIVSPTDAPIKTHST
jgi:hypothetical protein